MDFLFNTILVSDLEKSFNFYKDIIGLNLEKRFKTDKEVEIIFLEDSKGSSLELIKYGSNQDIDKNIKSKVKIGFAVDNLDQTIKDLKDKRIEIIEGPVEIKNGRFIDIKDPNGVLIGLYDFE
ncbi:MAG: VOC family protein [Halanaerobiales bacterium]|nr:VOC family protein [Halanaerobiales bacterium]